MSARTVPMLVRPTAPELGQRRRTRGFTLLELSIVLAVLGIAALITRAAIPADQRAGELAAAEIAEALRFAARQANAGDVSHGVEIDIANARVRVFRHDGSDPPNRSYDVHHPVSKQPWDVSLRALPGNDGLTLSAIPPAFQGTCNVSGVVVFDTWGVPRCDALPAVAWRAGGWRVSAGPEVALEGFSGRVSVQ